MLNRRLLPLSLVLGLAACTTQKPAPLPPGHGHARTVPAATAPAVSAPLPAATGKSSYQPLYGSSPIAPPVNTPPSVAQPSRQLADGSRVPALQSLLAAAQGQLAGGDLDGAGASLERAQRLAPQSATVYQRLADVRLRQQRPAEAEQLLRKALGFAGSPAQQAVIWRALAVAQQKQGNAAGAQDALARASALDGAHP
jgi:predicted Zn-dependent protease